MKISLYHQLLMHRGTLVVYGVSLLVLWCLNFDHEAVLIFTIWWAMDLLPALYLHLEYLVKNRGEEYVVSATELTLNKGGECKVFKMSEIERVLVCKSRSQDGWGIPLLTMESYFYLSVYIKDGRELVLTCLLHPQVDDEIRKLAGVRVDREPRLFNSIAWG